MINISSTSTMSGWYVSDIGQIMLPYFCWFLRPLWKNREPCGMYWSLVGFPKNRVHKKMGSWCSTAGMVNAFLESWLVVDLPLWKMMDNSSVGIPYMENTIVGIPFFHMKIIIPNIWQFPIKLFHGWFGIPEIWDSILKIKERVFPYILTYIQLWYFSIYPTIWVNYNNSLTWIKAICGWFPLLIMIPVRSQWGRYNLPRTMVLLDKISSRYPNIQSPRLDSAWSAGADGRPGWDLSVSMFDEWLMNHGNLPSGYLT